MLRYITICLLFPCFASAQSGDSVIRKGDTTILLDKKTSSEEIFHYVERMPEPGYNVTQFLQENIRYPDEAAKQKITGRVNVRFVVDTLGNIIDVKVMKPVHPLLDAEALRVVKKMPPWKPATQNGKHVMVYFTLPINFRL